MNTMKKQALLFAVVLSTLSQPAIAQAETPKPAPSGNNCTLLAPLEPSIVRKQFEQVVGEVLGKRAERWTVEDFQSVVAAAAACDRFVSDQRREIRGGSWAAQMEAAAKVIIPVSMAIRKADDDMGSALATTPWLPQCMSLFDWRRSRMSWKNNSATVFGTDFLKMKRQDLDLAKQRAVACKPALNLIGRARRGGDEVGDLIADDISYAVDRSVESQTEDLNERNVTAMDGDQRIPLSYTSQKARMMIGIVNRALRIGRSMTADETTELTAWADQTIAKSGNDADVAYARVVKDSIAKQIFRRDE
jgi:hypothetical protein